MPYRSRVVIYGERERGWRSAGAAETVAGLLGENTASSGPVKDAVRYSGWDEAQVRRSRPSARRPAGEAQRKGKFGGVLHVDLLERFCDMIMPVKRHRYSPSPGASPHGIDIIALGKPASDGKGRIVYAETRLRSKADPSALLAAHKSLAAAGSEDVPPSLKVTMEILREGGEDLYKRVMNASLGKAEAHFRIGAVVERSSWSDSQLDGPRQAQDAKELDLGVDVVKIDEQGDLVDESFRIAVAG